jgi:hypothetical protein
VSPIYVEQLKKMLTIFGKHSIKVMPCLTDFSAFAQGPKGNCRTDIITDPSMTRATSTSRPPWMRVPHVEASQRMPRLPWVCLGIAAVACLFEVRVARRQRRGAVALATGEASKALPEVPSLFRRAHILDTLATVAVGFPLASLAAGYDGTPSGAAVLAAAILAMASAWWLRRRARLKLGERSIHAGWLGLVLLAAAYGGGLWLASRLGGDAAAALVDVLRAAWPAALGALALLGTCVARSHLLEDDGVAGIERGDRGIGIAGIVASLVGLALQVGRTSVDSQPLPGALLARAVAAVGLLAGFAAVLVVQVRARGRRVFVARVVAGEVPGYRMAARDGDKVLLRAAHDADGYRAGDEELFRVRGKRMTGG